MDNVNEGHRERLRQRMLKEGLSGFQDHEVLEFLLFQYLPRKDTNKLAHALLNKFGCLTNVLDASPEQLMTIKGISDVTACNLAVLKEVWQRCRRDSAEMVELSKLSSIIEYAQKLIAESYIEKLVVVYVNSATVFQSRDVYTSNSRSEVNVDIKQIVTGAAASKAEGVLLFHCHVNGPCIPSAADFEFTDKLFVTLANMNMVLLEHIIFNSRDNFYSFYHEKYIDTLVEKFRRENGSKLYHA